MAEETIKTDVDRLLELLRINKKMHITQLSKTLNVSEEIIQSWVDFLVEEKIITVDYDFTKPILSLTKQEDVESINSKEDFSMYKKKFKNSQSQNDDPTEFAWKKHISTNLDNMKAFFYEEARKRKLEDINELWLEYTNQVTKI